MQSFFKYILIITIFFAGSCEKVITVDIEDVAPRYVIQGEITDDSTCRVRVSQTSNFNDTINLTGISGARVTISDEGRSAVLLSETSTRGIYRAPFSGKPGHTYNLRVEYPGTGGDERKVFTATSTMPQRVTLDSLFVTERVF
ncbi:DUF4249 domain-containing protein [Niabella ginsengisoli]|uniref:DUF4249 domain-containing protein n=1 Tax=Niabella ginsengisoli TaxID=522298 RepID=UPI0021D410CE|nr:DUF4249 domain-containing protein [Niabella ginsengisoli]